MIKRKLKNFKKSYSQCGEDMIINHIIYKNDISKFTYIDIGAHHPYYLNNTAFFYEKGARGINIESDIDLFMSFKRPRKNDTNLNIGIGKTKGDADFYRMTSKTLNTFSKNEAQKYQNENNIKISGISKVKINTIENIISMYANNKFPDFLSLDIEELDFEILKTINYEKSKPKIICVETISFSEKGEGIKDTEIINFLNTKGYFLYADTFINSIFVLTDFWKKGRIF